MGSQTETSTSNDRLRMFWTPVMERYFIELMLEHLHRGNRTGHTFNKEAWTDMLTVFNAKFGSQYDKDVLKSRYANLWKQFHDVKNLLCHIGFSWDAACQMVVADDFVWDAYIKTHPDARCYRTRSVLNFDDLCVIYGYATADGRYSLSSHDVSFDDEVLGLNLVVDDGMRGIAPSSNERPRTDWTAPMDQFFIELLLDQLIRGNKVDNTFNKEAWTDMLAMFNAKFGFQHGKRILRHRYRKLLKYYRDITVLLKGGFTWDEKQQMVAADDDVWDAYIKTHPHARTYRMKTFPNYRDLELIFRNGTDDEISNLHQEHNVEEVISELKAGKGSHNPCGIDRPRTSWTPPMDRCFIDLLLEQVKKGNKCGQTFLTQAWNDITTSFNKRFKYHHDKDVLKNRYKQLRRQFNDVDNLLQQSGFSWNDTREMVTAEDHVWDAYTKVHPEARSLRIKTLPGYRKLCVIFREEMSDRRYTRLACVADPSDELPMSITGEHQNSCIPSVYDAASTIEWTESMECYFIDLMIEQVNRGNGVRNTFNEQAWTHMIEAFSTKLGLQCDKQFLEDQYFCLMKQHDDISNLLNHGGFAWDETLQMVIAEHDVWEAYIKDHPDAISYRNRFLDFYPDLCKIFGNKVSNERVNVQGQLKWMELTDMTIEMDMDGTSGNLVVIGSHTEISGRDTERPREMDMDGTSGNLITEILDRDEERPNEMDVNEISGNLVVTGITEISDQDKERPNEIDTDETSENLLLTGNAEISGRDKERPREMDMDGTPGSFVVTGNNEILDQGEKMPYKMDTYGTSGNLVVTGNAEISDQDKRRPNGMEMDGTSGHLVDSGNTEISNRDKKRRSKILSNYRPPKKRAKKGLKMQKAMSDMAVAVKTLMNKNDKNNDKSFENALSALQAMPDIDEELVMDACDLLEDEKKAKTFLALDVSLRKKWLLRKLRP